ITHLPNPFADVPALYDLYQQVSERQPKLKLFGVEVFRRAISEADTGQLPIDLPASPDYVVGPGDGLEIDLWGGVSERLYRTVDREGRVALPEVGPVPVSGRPMAAVQQLVQQSLRSEFRDVSVDVSLARLRWNIRDSVRAGRLETTRPRPRGAGLWETLRHDLGTRSLR
ncbi:MAG: polysaccharide biosynthesis/export family protein, partial [Polyangiaceae bacterium]